MNLCFLSLWRQALLTWKRGMEHQQPHAKEVKHLLHQIDREMTRESAESLSRRPTLFRELDRKHQRRSLAVEPGSIEDVPVSRKKEESSEETSRSERRA